jgi:uncharacterized membrane protein
MNTAVTIIQSAALLTLIATVAVSRNPQTKQAGHTWTQWAWVATLVLAGIQARDHNWVFTTLFILLAITNLVMTQTAKKLTRQEITP